MLLDALLLLLFEVAVVFNSSVAKEEVVVVVVVVVVVGCSSMKDLRRSRGEASLERGVVAFPSRRKIQIKKET